MTPNKAIDRIYWRFGGNDNKKPFPVNEADVEAYNVLAKVVKEHQEQQFQNNELFAKLFIFTYKRLFEIEGGNILDNGMFAKRRKIYNLLQKPTFQLVEEFTKMLNEKERDDFLEEFIPTEITNLTKEECNAQGLKEGSVLVKNEPVTMETVEKFQNALKTPENELRLLGKVWEYEMVKECLEAEVNQAINLFDNG